MKVTSKPTRKLYGIEYTLNSNALYVYMRDKTNEDGEYEYQDILNTWLNTEIHGDEYVTLPLTDTQRRIALLMTEQEAIMLHNGDNWGEDDVEDFETVIETLCDIVNADPDCHVQWTHFYFPYTR